MAYQWVTIAGDFPPTLNKDAAPTGLKPNETPAGYGYNLAVGNRLASGACPTGTAATVQTYTISTVVYKFFYNRLWLASGNVLSYGSPEYTGAFLPQGLGTITFPEATTIYAYFPFGAGDLGVLTNAGAYLVPGAQNYGGGFERGHLIQELAIANADYAVELGGIIYVCNAAGLFAWKGEEVAELTLPVRNNVTGFASKALTADYTKRRIIGTSAFVYDVAGKRLFDFNTAGFLYTSPTVTSPQFRPFVVQRLGLVVEHANQDGGVVKVSTRVEDEDWTEPEDIDVQWMEDQFSRVEYALPAPQSARRFAMRITGLPANIYVKEIQAYAEGLDQGSYSK